VSTVLHRPVPARNYRLFVPKTFRSKERKVPMENFRSRGTKVPGNFRSRDLSFPYLRALFYNSSSNSVGRRVKLLEDVGFIFKSLVLLLYD